MKKTPGTDTSRRNPKRGRKTRQPPDVRLGLGVFIGAVVAVVLFVAVDLTLSHRRAVNQAEELALIQVQLVEQILTNCLAEVRTGLAAAAREMDIRHRAGLEVSDDRVLQGLLEEHFLFLEAVANAAVYDVQERRQVVLRRTEPVPPEECLLCPAFGASHRLALPGAPAEGLLWFSHRSEEGVVLKAVVRESYLTRNLQMILGDTMGGVLFSRQGEVVAQWGDPRGYAAAVRAEERQGVDQALFSRRREGHLVAVIRTRGVPLDVAVVLCPKFFLGQWRSRVVVLLLVSLIALSALGWFLRAIHRRAAQVWESREAKALAREREIQIRETHHRVKNHLTVIDSILSLQASRTPNPEIQVLLQDLRGRVTAISLIHSMLYQSEELGRVLFPDYCRSLIRYICQAYEAEGKAATLCLDIEEMHLPLEVVKPLGLIIQELVVNAFKYAGDSPEFSITLHFGQEEPGSEDQSRLFLLVADNGPGFPDDFTPREGDSLGMLLVQALVDDLEGEMIQWNQEGAHTKISFSLP
ncbi:Two-component sensor histidine kinase, contains HisKA and HATPase domains [Alkalispirochaeta americana]|uniref:histidine kinase n=1 Tax=Alkalispirochaeta americana TaxID=159291 RepID=A0A1N6Q5S2_9SPIO|nr:sensor histidine kinase [Alkalispirochaeta americana]SIQ11897.1 Two-component sensor histidine kinase, contains HisKA and HATPase domains [Alkalispirochaeta americana]